MRNFLTATAMGMALLASPFAAQAQVVDPTDLHLGSTLGTGTDPVRLNENTSFSLTDVNNAQSAFNLELIFAVPVFSGSPLVAPTLGAFTDSTAGETVTASPEINFTTTGRAGIDLFGTGSAFNDLYGYVGCAVCDNSLNKGNLETNAAFTSLFTAAQLANLLGFAVFEVPLSFSPVNDLLPQASITSTGDNLPLGTYVAALAFESDGVTPLATSFTNVGLVNQLSVDPVPEPSSLAIFGSALLGLGVVGWYRRRKHGDVTDAAAA